MKDTCCVQNTGMPKKHDLIPAPADWMKQASCVHYPTEWWTETQTGRRKTPLWNTHNNMRAKEVCYSCPVRLECLEFALHNEDHNNAVPWAIYGGNTPVDRLMLTGHLVFGEAVIS